MEICKVWIFLVTACAFCAAFTSDKEAQVVEKLLENYNKQVRPPGLEEGEIGPVNVSVNFYMRQISEFDPINMRFYGQLTLRQQWMDTRLAFKDHTDFGGRYLQSFKDEIWRPDTFLQNNIETRKHDFDFLNSLIRVYKDGAVLYSIRISSEFSCPMSFQRFPYDKQECSIDLASYSWTTDDIVYKWKDTSPIQLKAGLKQSIPSYELTDVETDMCTSKTNTGEYSCLRGRLHFKRISSHYLMNTYIPSIMIVIMSWLALFINKRHIGPRVVICLVSIILLTAGSHMVHSELPKVSYTTFFDVWMGVCFLFVFLVFLLIILANFFASGPTCNNRPPPSPLNYRAHDEEKAFMPMETNAPRREKSDYLDWLGRIMLPILFIIFNFIYWIIIHVVS